jgi:hypothetical protein
MRNSGSYPIFAMKHVVVSGNPRSILKMAQLSDESVKSSGIKEVATQRNFAAEPSTQRRCSGRTLTNFCNAHGYARNPPDDGDVARIANAPSVSTGMRSRNQYQLVAIQFTPTADIAIAKFEEKDRAVKVVMPIYERDGSLPGIDLDEGTGANDGVECAVLHSNVAVKGIAPIDLLQ